MGHLSKERIAELVRGGRAAKGYTQQEVSDLAGISLRSVQRIENAEVLPRLYTLKTLSVHLGFELELTPQALGAKSGDQVRPDEHIVTRIADQVGHSSSTSSRRGLNTTQRVILSICCGLLLFCLVGAYIFQSTWHPETQFEWAVLVAILVSVFGLLLLWIWKSSPK